MPVVDEEEPDISTFWPSATQILQPANEPRFQLQQEEPTLTLSNDLPQLAISDTVIISFDHVVEKR